MTLVYDSPAADISVMPYGDKIKIDVSIDPSQIDGGTLTVYVFPEGTLPRDDNGNPVAVLPENADSVALHREDIPITKDEPNKTVFVKLPEGRFDILLLWDGEEIYAMNYVVGPLSVSGPLADSLFLLGLGTLIFLFAAKLGSR